MGNPYGRNVVLPLTNQSGGSVAAGDFCYLDTAHDDAFITGTTGAYTGAIGIAQQAIGAGSVGLVLVQGYAALVNVNASVTRGHFGKGHTVAKQATDAGTSRIAGTFCQFLTGGTTPDAMIWQPDLGAGSGLTDPMTTRGDIIVRNASNVSARLAVGASGRFLGSDGTDASWTVLPASGAMTLITDTTLGSDTASFDFTSIPGTYKHLKIIVTGRTINSGSDTDFITLRLNNDSGANYDGIWTQIFNGYTTSSFTEDVGQTSWAHSMLVPGATSTTGAVATAEFLIADYIGTIFHKVITMHGFDVKAESSSNVRQQSGGGVWRSTAAVTRVTLAGAGNSWKTGSRASLYGIS